MHIYFLIQIISLIAGLLIITLSFDFTKAVDFCLGFLAVLIPNTAFAINLVIMNKILTSAGTKVLIFFIGEIVKIIFVLLLLYIFSVNFFPLDWLIFLCGVLVSLKVVYVLPFFVSGEKKNVSFLSCKK